MFFLIWKGLFMFRHRSARLLMCKRAQFHHAIAMTQIYSQEMSEVFQFSYFDMEDTFSSFGTVAHYFFLFHCWTVWFFETVSFSWQMCKRRFICFCWTKKKHLHFAIPDTIRFDWPSVGWSAFIRLISWYYVLFDPRTKALLSKYIQYTYGKRTQESKRARGCGPLSQVYGSLQLAYKFSHQFHNFEWKTNW